MQITIIVKQKDTRCYKFDEGCCGCNDAEILKRRLTCKEIEGHVVVLTAEPLFNKEGFMCNKCIANAKNDPSIIVKE